MCGFAGFFQDPESFSLPEGEQALRRMVASLTSRGPDGGGLWLNPQAGVALGHRRLSILDLSPLGRQPMRTACGRYTVVYNGELYNYLFLKKNLEEEKIVFKSHSDTEVLLAAFQVWGVEKTCALSRGMYAFALWDEETKTLTLGRDPFGIKPLYWGLQKGCLFFGSHSQSIRVHPTWESRLCPQALEAYGTYGYVPAPLAIDQDMHKVNPGTFLVFGQDRSLLREVKFWDGISVAQEGIKGRDQWPLSETETSSRLKSLLLETVGNQMESDVPLGAFLSGGIDSSLIVASMQSQRTHPIQTFSIGFTDPDFDEAPYARAVARHLGTDHHEVYLTPEEVMTFIPQLPDWYDEPFADSSQLPTFLVSQKAREKVTVCLSGDGGDELFGGYNRYRIASYGEQFLTYMPLRLRSWLKGQIQGGNLFNFLRLPQWAQKIQKIEKILDSETDLDLYKRLLTFRDSKGRPQKEGDPFQPPWEASWNALPTFLDRMQASDIRGYLPDDILTKVDRASMAVGLEARVPFLDPDVAAFAWSLPPHFKQRGGVGKWILRRVLETYMPSSLFERPKMGFSIPLGSWLRGPLKAWAEALLFSSSWEEESIFRKDVLKTTWTHHQEGIRDWGSHLWIFFIFQQWYASRKDQRKKNDKRYQDQLSLPCEEVREKECFSKFF